MTPDLRQLQPSHAGGEELAQPLSSLPALIFDVLWMDVVDTRGLAYPQLFDGQLNFTPSEITRKVGVTPLGTALALSLGTARFMDSF